MREGEGEGTGVRGPGGGGLFRLSLRHLERYGEVAEAKAEEMEMKQNAEEGREGKGLGGEGGHRACGGPGKFG